MGACNASSKKSPLSFPTPKSPHNLNTQQTQVDFYPPPNLFRKSSQSPLIKVKKDLFHCVTGFELNKILEEGGNIESNLSVYLGHKFFKTEVINQTNVHLLLQIQNEKKCLKSYIDPELIEKILEDYEYLLYEKYKNLAKDEKNWNKAENFFSTNILFLATEIYQILLSFKKKKKKKQLNYWWMPPLVNFSDTYDEYDTYCFLRKKIIHLELQLKFLFTSTLGSQFESQLIKKESTFIENSESHQAMKCQEYNLSMAPLVKP